MPAARNAGAVMTKQNPNEKSGESSPPNESRCSARRRGHHKDNVYSDQTKRGGMDRFCGGGKVIKTIAEHRDELKAEQSLPPGNDEARLPQAVQRRTLGSHR